MGFKKDFVWGVATAAFQIEGAVNEDGRGLSNWDVYCKIEGNILYGDNADIACDHYHRYKEDVKLMAELGVKAYRFSISWSRVMPEGTGKVNQKGLDFYSDLVDELLKYNITPYVTLFHWDYPQKLMEKGSWGNSDSPIWFRDYVKVVAARLGDRVKHFVTFNEPQCFLGLGYSIGSHAPGLKLHTCETIPMVHHVLMAHGLATMVLREIVPDCKVGFAPCGDVTYPATDNALDIEAARAEYFKVTKDWEFSVSWYSDPVMLGCYPEDGLSLFEQYLPRNYQEDMKTIHQPLDFYGQNIYNGREITLVDGKPQKAALPQGFARTAMGWSIAPKALYWGPKFLYERYGLPIIITENGMSCHDAVSLDGKVHDPNRIDYIARYVSELCRAANDGVPVDGYFAWSLMDNFEWAKGYHERFGLIYVDYQTGKRIPKDSFYWYRDVIGSNGELL